MEVSMNSNSLLLGLSFAGITLALFARTPTAVAQESNSDEQDGRCHLIPPPITFAA